MLICEYKCEECGCVFEMTRQIDEVGNVACPRCGSLSVVNTSTIAASCSGALKS